MLALQAGSCTGPTAHQPTRAQRRATVAALAALAATLSVVGAVPASAVTDTDTTVANVVVESAITLSGLTPSFTLTGAPGDTISGPAAVTMNVVTNSITGYIVTVQAESATLAPTANGNTDTIPIADLGVRESGAADPTYTPLSDTTPVTVHSQTSRSATSGGDDIGNDFQITIPDVNSDTYSVTLDYVAATQ